MAEKPKIDPESTERVKKGFWRSIGSTIKKAAGVTGRGIQYVYRKGDENKHYVLPAVNGIVGDKLSAAGDSRAIQMSFRHNDKDVTPAHLFQILRAQEPRTVVVFVHGLMADEVLWQTVSADERGYGPRLETDAGTLCLYVRYNSGRHISENGRDLSALLNELTVAFGPVMKDLILVAHSMGGLVARSAGHYGKLAHAVWIPKVSRIVLIGVPNDGSFLEKFGHLATLILKKIWNYPTRLVGRIADERSAGIKDLRWGFLVDEDWQQEGADALTGVKRTLVPPLPNIQYYVFLGTLTESVDSPVALYFGDGLVGTDSAAGKAFAPADDPAHPFVQCRAFPATGHVGLLTSNDVYQNLLAVVVR